MLGSFTQSDIIAIVVGVLQIVVMIALSVWTVSRSGKKQRQTADRPLDRKLNIILLLLKYSWVFPSLLSIFGVYKITSLYAKDALVTSTYLYNVVFWHSYVLANLILLVISLIVPDILQVVSRIVQILGIHGGLVSAVVRFLTSRSRPTRRKRRG
jgi:hypothetical protein